MAAARPMGKPDPAPIDTLRDGAKQVSREPAGIRVQDNDQETAQQIPLPRSPADAAPFKLSILMPAYNEEATIDQAIKEVLSTEYPCPIELIVVDDGSTDGTGALLAQVRDDRVTIHRHPANRGKGAALLTAAALASGSHVLPFDADLEYQAADIPNVVAPVLTGRCSVVYGTRLFGFNAVYQSYRYALGNRLLTLLANVLFNAYLSDLHTCLKLMPLPMFRDLTLRESGFGLDTEMTALLLRRGVRPFEVPVSYYSRSHEQGKKISWRDAAVCVKVLVRVHTQGSPSGRRRDGDKGSGIDQPRLPGVC